MPCEPEGRANVNSAIGRDSLHESKKRFRSIDHNQISEKSDMEKPNRITAYLVDDCSAVRGALTEMLTVLGYNVTSASSGHQALAKLGKAETTLGMAVLDMEMPGLTGVQTLSRLRERHPQLPAVLMSGRHECYFRSQLELLTHYVFLQKPFNMSQLEQAVASAQAGV